MSDSWLSLDIGDSDDLISGDRAADGFEHVEDPTSSVECGGLGALSGHKSFRDHHPVRVHHLDDARSADCDIQAGPCTVKPDRIRSARNWHPGQLPAVG